MDRTAWVDKDVFDKPYGINSSGVLYVHERGKDDDAVPFLPLFVQLILT